MIFNKAQQAIANMIERKRNISLHLLRNVFKNHERKSWGNCS
jgi:hypothetical protein